MESKDKAIDHQEAILPAEGHVTKTEGTTYQVEGEGQRADTTPRGTAVDIH